MKNIEIILNRIESIRINQEISESPDTTAEIVWEFSANTHSTISPAEVSLNS